MRIMGVLIIGLLLEFVFTGLQMVRASSSQGSHDTGLKFLEFLIIIR